MFAKEKPRTSSATADGALNGAFSMIGADVSLTGDLKAEADLHFDGRMEGDLECATLVQGKDSVIVGSVKAAKIRLAGRVEGSVEAGELVIEASARVSGELSYDSISIAEGATVEGRFRKNGGAANDAARGRLEAVEAAPVAIPAE